MDRLFDDSWPESIDLSLVITILGPLYRQRATRDASENYSAKLKALEFGPIPPIYIAYKAVRCRWLEMWLGARGNQPSLRIHLMGFNQLDNWYLCDSKAATEYSVIPETTDSLRICDLLSRTVRCASTTTSDR